MAHMGKVSRLPSDEQVRMHEIHAEKPLTFQAVKAMRDRLAEVVEVCGSVERVLDQVETVLRQDELRDMPVFNGCWPMSSDPNFLTLTIDASARLENLKRRIRR